MAWLRWGGAKRLVTPRHQPCLLVVYRSYPSHAAASSAILRSCYPATRIPVPPSTCRSAHSAFLSSCGFLFFVSPTLRQTDIIPTPLGFNVSRGCGMRQFPSDFHALYYSSAFSLLLLQSLPSECEASRHTQFRFLRQACLV